MLLNIILFKNKTLGCFGQPQFDDHEPEKAAVQLARAIKKNVIDGKANDVRTFRGLVMFTIGSFDDETGEAKLYDQPKKLLECDTVFAEAEKEACEVSKDGN